MCGMKTLLTSISLFPWTRRLTAVTNCLPSYFLRKLSVEYPENCCWYSWKSDAVVKITCFSKMFRSFHNGIKEIKELWEKVTFVSPWEPCCLQNPNPAPQRCVGLATAWAAPKYGGIHSWQLPACWEGSAPHFSDWARAVQTAAILTSGW